MQETDQSMLLEFSNTGQKIFRPDETETLKKQLEFEITPPTCSYNTQSFFEEFDRHFAVTFVSQNEDECMDNVQECQSRVEQSCIGIDGMQGICIKDIDFSFPPLNGLPSILSQNQKAVKSEIFAKDSFFPNFHIKKRVVFKEKKNIAANSHPINNLISQNSTIIGKLPKTCRNNRKCAPLYFTSKATPKDAEIAKNLMKKQEKKYSQNNPFSARGLIEDARTMVDATTINLQSKSKFQTLLTRKGEEKLLPLREDRGRLSIFQKLPAIR